MHAVRLAADIRSSLIVNWLAAFCGDLTARHPDVSEVAGLRTFRHVDGEQAAADFDELRALYTELYAEPPYGRAGEHANLFAERFDVQRSQEGIALVEARDGTDLAGLSFGVTCSRPRHGGTT
jgi:hypothetical protein